MHAAGEFEVTLQPLNTTMQGKDGTDLSRMSINKTFHGNLEAASRGEMLSARRPEQGAAGYVAIEQVRGELQGRSGSFVLQHFGVMHGDENRLNLEVMPGSGTGDLTGLTGTMRIDIREGRHFYEFDYTL